MTSLRRRLLCRTHRPGLAATKTQNSVSLTWNAGPASVTGYQVTVYDAAGAKLGTQPPVTAVPRQTVSGLQPGTAYGFTVAAKNAGGSSAESAKVTATTNQATDSITISTAKWKAGDFKIVGTGNTLGAIVQAYRVQSPTAASAPRSPGPRPRSSPPHRPASGTGPSGCATPQPGPATRAGSS